MIRPNQTFTLNIAFGLISKQAAVTAGIDMACQNCIRHTLGKEEMSLLEPAVTSKGLVLKWLAGKGSPFSKFAKFSQPFIKTHL